MATDYYEALGVARDASEADIKKAYRRLARELHPDANPGDAAAEERFRDVALAYEVLSDPHKRQRYDRFGADGVTGAGGDPFGGGGLGDIFDAFFGGGAQTSGPSGTRSGEDLETVVNLTFEEAVFGAAKEVDVRTAVPCDPCEATGAAPGSSAETCSECNGAGQVRRVRNSILGQMVSASVCPSCSGMGQRIAEPCETCNGDGRTIVNETYTVDIPAGVDSGSTLRLSGRGAVGQRGGAYGDLYVRVRVGNHDRFDREGNHLISELHIGIAQAALGAHVIFETLDGPEDLVIPPGTQTGKGFRLRDHGVPLVQGRGRGDLLVRIVVDVPTKLSSEESQALRHFAELRGEDVAPEDSGFFSKIKSAFK